VKIVFTLSNNYNLSEGLNEGLNEGLSEGLREGLNEGLISLLNAIIKNPNIQAKDISSILSNRPLKTIERQLSQLVKIKKIERKGSRKTGGYFPI